MEFGQRRSHDRLSCDRVLPPARLIVITHLAGPYKGSGLGLARAIRTIFTSCHFFKVTHCG